MPFDETEAYLRHRARVHEREKRERLRKEGKLEAYLAEIESNKVKIESEKNHRTESDRMNKMMEEYYAIKKLDKENLVVGNQIRLNNAFEERAEEIVYRKKKVKRRRKKRVMEEENQSVILDDAEFKPQMAGSTGLPSFFFNNLVETNRSVFARCRVTCRPKKI